MVLSVKFFLTFKILHLPSFPPMHAARSSLFKYSSPLSSNDSFGRVLLFTVITYLLLNHKLKKPSIILLNQQRNLLISPFLYWVSPVCVCALSHSAIDVLIFPFRLANRKCHQWPPKWNTDGVILCQHPFMAPEAKSVCNTESIAIAADRSSTSDTFSITGNTNVANRRPARLATKRSRLFRTWSATRKSCTLG